MVLFLYVAQYLTFEQDNLLPYKFRMMIHFHPV